MLISHHTRAVLRDKISRVIGANPCRVQSAALPWRTSKRGIEIMLVTSRGTGRWVLPKGWPEVDETLAETAAREALEEAGIEGGIATEEVGRYYYGKVQPGGLEWRCEVAIFPLKVTHEVKKWPEMKKRTRRWFTPRDAARLVDERDLGELIARFDGGPMVRA